MVDAHLVQGSAWFVFTTTVITLPLHSVKERRSSNMTSIVGAAVPFKNESPAATTTAKKDESRTMLAVQWQGTRDIVTGEVPVPMLTDPKLPGMKKGDIMGHEPMGIVEEVGPEVQKIKKGDRVVVASNISCGQCYYCKKELYIYCDTTNSGKEQDMIFGHHTAGLLGYSHLVGGYEGGQAEYLRVPFADVSCLVVPEDIPDEKAVTLGDLCCTSWHGCELGEVSEGDNVAVWGAGPIGIVAAHCAFVRGAARVVLIDEQQYRLDFAKEKMPRLETINFREKKVIDTLHEMFPESRGPDVGIECVGFHYAENLLQKIQMKLNLVSDTSEIVNEIMESVRKCGRVSVIGDYAGYCNQFNIGALMEKGLTVKSGMTSMQRYWPILTKLIQEGKLDPSMPITHKLPLRDAASAYKHFNDKDGGYVKVIFNPALDRQTAKEQ